MWNKTNFRFKILHDGSGFTILEMLIAIAIFSVFIVTAVGAFLSFIQANAKSISLAATVDTMAFMIEDMSRAIRDGSLYHCDVTFTPPPIDRWRSCPFPGGVSSMVLEKAGGNTLDDTDQVIYRFQETSGHGKIEKSVDGGSTYTDMTGPKIDVDFLRFHVRGAEPNDNNASRALIVMRGTALSAKSETVTPFSFQTTIEQREPDN